MYIPLGEEGGSRATRQRMPEGSSPTVSLPEQAVSRVSQVLEDAIHFTEGVTAEATSAVVHSPEKASQVLEEARHLAEDAVHGVEGAVHSIENVVGEVIHQADDVRSAIVHTPEHASRALEEAWLLAEEAVRKIERVPEQALASLILEENIRLKAMVEDANHRAGEAQAPLQHALGLLAREKQERERLEQLVVQLQCEVENKGDINRYLEESGVEVR